MSILEPDHLDPADEAGLARVIADAAAGGDWRAAAFLLDRHPLHRDAWSSQEPIRREVDRLLGMVARGIRDSGLRPEQQQLAIYSIRAAGAGIEEPTTDD